MEKKKYIKPNFKFIGMYSEQHLVANTNVHEVNNNVDTHWAARESSIWDDEEEEENTGGWFQ